MWQAPGVQKFDLSASSARDQRQQFFRVFYRVTKREPGTPRETKFQLAVCSRNFSRSRVSAEAPGHGWKADQIESLCRGPAERKAAGCTVCEIERKLTGSSKIRTSFPVGTVSDVGTPFLRRKVTIGNTTSLSDPTVEVCFPEDD